MDTPASREILCAHLWPARLQLQHFDAINHIRTAALDTNVMPDTHLPATPRMGFYPHELAGHRRRDEHPPNSSCFGENWTVTQLNALMQGDWATTAVFLTWDDFGGFYDHVPCRVDIYGFGLACP